MPSRRKSAGSPIVSVGIETCSKAVVVHECRLAALGIEKLHLLFVEADAFDGFLGAEAVVELDPAAQVAHLDLGKGAALAGLDQLALQHDPQLALVFEDIARLDVDGVDLHDLGILVGRDRARLCPRH